MVLRSVLILFLCFGFISVYSQPATQVKTKTSYIKGSPIARTVSIHSLMTHQADDGQRMNTSRHRIANEHMRAEPQRFVALADNQLTADDEIRAYKRVIDVNEHDNLSAGLTTHQIQGRKEYILWEFEQQNQKLMVELTPQGIKAYLQEIEAPLMASLAEIPEDTELYTKYRITEKGYQYYDGKPIVGNELIQQKLEEGYKPITMATLYFEIKKIGLISEDTTLSQFSAMTVEEQKALLSQVAISD